MSGTWMLWLALFCEPPVTLGHVWLIPSERQCHAACKLNRQYRDYCERQLLFEPWRHEWIVAIEETKYLGRQWWTIWRYYDMQTGADKLCQLRRAVRVIRDHDGLPPEIPYWRMEER